MMTNRQVRKYYIDKEHTDHPITDRLISGGYMQSSGEYISNTRSVGIEAPSQYWHLIHSWFDNKKPEAPFNKTIQCGELIFWMAETSGAVSKPKLNELCDQVLSENVADRSYWNRTIRSVCFDSIEETVTKAVL